MWMMESLCKNPKKYAILNFIKILMSKVASFEISTPDSVGVIFKDVRYLHIHE